MGGSCGTGCTDTLSQGKRKRRLRLDKESGWEMESKTLGEERKNQLSVEPEEGIGTGLAGKLCVGRDRMPMH